MYPISVWFFVVAMTARRAILGGLIDASNNNNKTEGRRRQLNLPAEADSTSADIVTDEYR
jgi:hypothetical protein